ncbi:MAG: nicotinate-nucleotide adenylyltransferase, partial [Lachnospiraceae bacterium]|nr:nicotinate-nucleotide adenylyltransferase [Lachnospiraceae bacterium]
IYGGTFNPIHNGHIKLAENAKRLYQLDKVIFLPSGNSYMKSNVLSGWQRYHMVCLALMGRDGLVASDLEIRREGATYSYETMEEFHDIYPNDELFFLLGEDSLRMIEWWKEPARLMGQCSLIVASRMMETSDDPVGGCKVAVATQNGYAANMQLPQYIRYLEEKYHTHIYCIEMQDATSSSRIRESVAGGQEIDGMVPDAVRDYIRKEHLYRSI